MRIVPAGAPVVTAAAMRAAEEQLFSTGVEPSALMQRAGEVVAVQIARLAAGRPILVVAGPGRNGGGAYASARWLLDRGHDVVVAVTPGGPDAPHPGPKIPLEQATPRAILVDGLFGIGLSRPIDAVLAGQFAALRAGAALTIAIDVPSGFGIDDGTDMGGPGADITLALGALKPVHVIGAGAVASGRVVLLDIGVPVESDWRSLAKPQLPAPQRDANKFSRGMVAVVGGAMPGAGRLAARGAMAGGAGYVVLASDQAVGGPDALVRRAADDALYDDKRIGALLVGPGLGPDATARTLLNAALRSGRSLTLDGDALTLLGTEIERKVRGLDVILTPHSGEFDRMFGTAGGNKIARTIAAARACRCTIVHKGADTVIAHADGRVAVASAASPWLAPAGSGDVLAGLVAARRAAGDALPAEAAVWLHTRAADLAGPAMIADTLVEYIPDAMRDCV